MASKFVRPSFPRRLGSALAVLGLTLGMLSVIAPAAFAVTPCGDPTQRYSLTVTVPDDAEVEIEYVSAGNLNVTTKVGINEDCVYYTDVYELDIKQANGGDEAYVTIVVSDTADLPTTTVTLGNGDDELTLEGTSGNDNLDATELDIDKPGGGDDGLGWLLFVGGGGNDLMVETGAVKNVNKYHVIFGGGAGTDTADRSQRDDDLTYTLPLDVENYIGGQKKDVVTGTAVANRITGGDDEDTLKGMGGNDVLIGDEEKDDLRGGDGNDILVGGDDEDDYDGGPGTDLVSFNNSVYEGAVDVGGVDVGAFIDLAEETAVENVFGSTFDDDLSGDAKANYIDGYLGDDTIKGAKGEDVLDGGLGSDTVSYAGSSAAVKVNLAAAYPTGGDASGDLIGGFENVIGSNYGDSLTGTATANEIHGGKGNDALVGLGGADVLDGGSGSHDAVSYAASSEGVTVSLAARSGKGGDAEGDSLIKVEDVTGSEKADTLVGSAVANILNGGGGNDMIMGGLWGDVIDGGAGSDTASYADSNEGVKVTLRGGSGKGGVEGEDSLKSIENLIGSPFADTLVGDDAANAINGSGGDDIVSGSGGADRLYGSNGNDKLSGGDGNDLLDPGAGNDRVDGGAGTDTCKAGPGQNTVTTCEN